MFIRPFRLVLNAALAVAFCVYLSSPVQAQNDVYQKLSESLSRQLQAKSQRLAVVDFTAAEPGRSESASDHSATGTRQSENTALGAYLAEQLLPALMQNAHFVLVERQALKQVIQEQGFHQSLWANTEQATQLGRLSGAEYLLLGRYLNLSQHVELNLRLIHVETGEIAALAHSRLPKTDTHRELLGEATQAEQGQALASEFLKLLMNNMRRNPLESAGQRSPEPLQRQRLFFEDFSKFAPGTRLPAWGPQWVVRSSQKHPMHVLTTEALSTQNLGLPVGEWPENFALEIHAIDIRKSPDGVSHSPLRLSLRDRAGRVLQINKVHQAFALGAQAPRMAPWRHLGWNVLALVKQGPQWSLWVNGQPVQSLHLPLQGVSQAYLQAPSLRNWAFTRFSLYRL